MQLSHSGRQQDLGGVENLFNKGLSSTNKMDFFHGLLAQAMTVTEIHQVVEQFAQGARRAKDAGLDGVELHGANGYLITQFLSSGINDRTDDYGGPAEIARGILVPPRDPAALAKAIRSVQPGSLVAEARAHVEKNFDMRKIVPVIESFYESL
jgi:hypothetical protein